MAECAFQTQLTAIMDTMAKTALARIFKLFEEDSSKMRKEMSRLTRENKVLKDRLLCMENKFVLARHLIRGEQRTVRPTTEVLQTGGETKIASENSIRRGEDGHQIKVLTIKEEEMEADISEANSPPAHVLAEENQIWVYDGRESTSIDGDFQNCMGNIGQSTWNDCPDDLDTLPASSRLLEDQQKGFISLDRTCMPATDPSEYDLHCVPIEYEYEDAEGEAVKETIAFEGLLEHPRQLNIKALKMAKQQKSEDFDRLKIQKTRKRRNKCHCNLCGKMFAKYTTLKSHMAVHKRDSKYRCQICKIQFPQKNLLRTHKCSVAVASIKPRAKYRCENCGRCFANTTGLRVHYVVHTGEKPYKCDICGKAFTQKGNMNIHRRIHTGEKPFSCSVCLKNFAQKITLQQHMKRHGKAYVNTFRKHQKRRDKHIN